MDDKANKSIINMSVLQNKLDLINLLGKLDECLALCTQEEAQKLLLELMQKNVPVDKLKSVVEKSGVNFGDEPETSPLFYACRYSKAHYVKFLIDNGVDVNRVTSRGSNAIMYSYQEGDFESYMMLFNKGCPLKTDKKILAHYPCHYEDKRQAFMEKLMAEVSKSE